MYEKVSTDLNFVDREKQVEKFWKDEKIFEKSNRQPTEKEPHTYFMTDRLPQTASRISDTYLPVLSRI